MSVYDDPSRRMKAPISTDMQVYLDRVEEDGQRTFGTSCSDCQSSNNGPCNPCKLSLVFWILRHPSPVGTDWEETQLTTEEQARRVGGG